MITSLNSNEIFVFGSNLLGHHAGGAARQAHEQFGAVWGQGEGLQGQSYAFPTLGEDMQQLPRDRLIEARDNLYKTCEALQGNIFLLTPVGTGIAGYDTEYMASLFENAPSNLVLPEEFKN